MPIQYSTCVIDLVTLQRRLPRDRLPMPLLLLPVRTPPAPNSTSSLIPEFSCAFGISVVGERVGGKGDVGGRVDEALELWILRVMYQRILCNSIHCQQRPATPATREKRTARRQTG